MIKLTINKEEYQIKNRFDEVTVKELDMAIYLLSKATTILDWIDVVAELSDCPKEKLENIRVGDFRSILNNMFIDKDEYPQKLEYGKYKIRTKDNKLDLTGKQIKQLQSCMGADNIDKTGMTLAILFKGDYDEDLFKEIQEELASEFINTIGLVHTINLFQNEA